MTALYYIQDFLNKYNFNTLILLSELNNWDKQPKRKKMSTTKPSPHKMTLSQWQQFSRQISSSKQAIQQLSKLYTIIHQRVKSTIRNSVTNPKTNFSRQIQSHIEFIQSVLQRMRDVQSDSYLMEIERKVLVKYEESLMGLMEQIQAMLKVEQSRLSLECDRLMSVGQEKRVEYDLRSEIDHSGNRVVRAKSGKKRFSNDNNGHNQNHTSISNNKNQTIENDNGSFFPTMIQPSSSINNINYSNIQKAYETKRSHVIQSMRKSMSPSKSGRGVSFKNKYQNNYLEMYFNERKQFAQLIFNQQAYDKIIDSGHKHYDKQTRQSQRMDSKLKLLKGMKFQDINQKLFPQFQIKTKFLKPNVKQTIANLITDIKKQLINQYFIDNVQTIKTINQNQKMKVDVEMRKNNNMKKTYGSQSLQNIRRVGLDENNFYSQKQGDRAFRNTQFGPTTTQSETPIQVKRSNSFSAANHPTISSTILKTRKSFINTSVKPFYLTEKWNQQTEKIYSNRIMSKLIKAKIPC